METESISDPRLDAVNRTGALQKENLTSLAQLQANLREAKRRSLHTLDNDDDQQKGDISHFMKLRGP